MLPVYVSAIPFKSIILALWVQIGAMPNVNYPQQRLREIQKVVEDKIFSKRGKKIKTIISKSVEFKLDDKTPFWEELHIRLRHVDNSAELTIRLKF